MAERERQVSRLAEEGAEPESIDVLRLPVLLGVELPPKGPDRSALALQINTVLVAMRQRGHEEAESRELLAGLDAHRFDDLVDPAGRSCRKEAVETLLECGFPHALKISPEDLEYARRYVPPSIMGLTDMSGTDTDHGGWDHKLGRARKNGLVLTLGGQGLFLVVALLTGALASMGLGATICLLAAVLAAGASFLFTLQGGATENQAGFGMVLGMLALLQVVCALEVGFPALVGAAGILAGLMACFAPHGHARADPPKPGDWDYMDPGNGPD